MMTIKLPSKKEFIESMAREEVLEEDMKYFDRALKFVLDDHKSDDWTLEELQQEEETIHEQVLCFIAGYKAALAKK